jgi:hypothetical protein
MEPIHAARAASYSCHSNEGERRALCTTVSCSLYTLRAQQATVAIYIFDQTTERGMDE